MNEQIINTEEEKELIPPPETGVIYLENKGSISPQRNGLVVGLLVTSLVGVLIGALLGRIASENQVESILNNVVFSKNNKEFFQLMLSSFFSIQLVLIGICILGFSAITSPLIALAPILRGVGLGFIIGCLYIKIGFASIPVALIYIVPEGVLGTFLIVIASKEGVRFSGMIYTLLRRPIYKEKSRGQINDYVGKFIFFTFLAIIISAISAGVIHLFSANLSL